MVDLINNWKYCNILTSHNLFVATTFEKAFIFEHEKGSLTIYTSTVSYFKSRFTSIEQMKDGKVCSILCLAIFPGLVASADMALQPTGSFLKDGFQSIGLTINGQVAFEAQLTPLNVVDTVLSLLVKYSRLFETLVNNPLQCFRDS